ncbi:class I SAM-dependent RNA methyltransferase [Roseiterribacter gracilis]|uniref:class I SAM-dependent RNA methyltransferase n=1 Tax=Roseiterribacter gracilis TaxID=2812848 RepID=UPI003B431A76
MSPPVPPPCRHAGVCGGCAVQAVEDGAVAAWKRDHIANALQRVGLSAEIEPTATVAPATRRRATLTSMRQGKHVLLGFNERRSDRIVELRECKVLTPKLEALLPALRDLVGILLQQRDTADLALTEAQNGIELVVVRKRALALLDLETLAAFAETHDLARVAWRSTVRTPVEPIAVRRVPTITLGGVRVALPPAAFLQPSADGENLLIDRVQATMTGAKRIADFFCGVGTFALPLAASGATVTAFDGDKDAVAALAATRKTTAIVRDLFREPLSEKELRDFDAAVLDPPRAGAAAQVATLADADFDRLTYVSCNPASFARDARVLVAGGWKLGEILPVDQFRWSAHVELVARLSR